jgi:imidazole glycerol-phosphate synthase subunit HisH
VIALVDYGAGNLTSVRKALSTLGAEFTTPRTPDALAGVAGIIVPGVGHFEATRAIDHGWRSAIVGSVDRGAGLLGICLGMQWLFEGSLEAPALSGLGMFRGSCVHLREENAQRQGGPTARFKVPHVGWNSLEGRMDSTLMQGVGDGAQVYFTHSYVAPVVAETAAVTTYGRPFSAVVERGRVAGVQFHPEKSGDVGLCILRNWLDAL